MKLYSGQGRVYAAKRNVDGSFQKRFFCGNVPEFRASFDTGDIVITIEDVGADVLELLCGSQRQQVPASSLEPLDFGEFEKMDWSNAYPPMESVDVYDIGDPAPIEYGLFFQGVNTAEESDYFRLELYRVVIEAPANGWQFISEGFASMVVKAKALRDEARDNKMGRLYHAHKESWSGSRSTDQQTAGMAV